MDDERASHRAARNVVEPPSLLDYVSADELDRFAELVADLVIA
jgi:hypothetical protein